MINKLEARHKRILEATEQVLEWNYRNTTLMLELLNKHEKDVYKKLRKARMIFS